MTPHEQIAAIFRAEVASLLDSLAQGVEALPGLSGEPRRELVERCIRTAHNIKGIAASVGIQPIAELAHATETALVRHRGDPGLPLDATCPAVLQAVTAMEQLAQGRSPPETATLAAHLVAGTAPAPAAAAGPGGAESQASASVRVESSRLDRLMGFTGELLSTHARLVARNEALVRLHESLHASLAGLEAPARAALAPCARGLQELLDDDRREQERFGRLTRDLGAAMKQVRMTPLSGLAPTWRQLVRESAQQLGRQVELKVEVGEIELDKYVLDRLRDPVIHLLRNCVAHGLEPDRKAAGKPPVGRIRVSAAMHGPQVRLQVCDDGRGLDPERIGEAAVRRGLLTPELLAERAPSEILELIFEEGFSTAEQVGPVSGRGVGLSVVKGHVAELGGHLTVSAHSDLGGAGFELFLPVTVVSRRGLLVRAAGSIYALPIEHVQRTLRVDPGTLAQVEGEPVLQRAGEDPLRLRWLAPLMGRHEPRRPGPVFVVVLERGSAALALAVDAVQGEAEYVIKRLPSNLSGVRGVDGAVVLADGSVAVAVNVPDLFLAPSGMGAPPATAPVPKAARKRVLVADDMLTTRALHRTVLESAGYEVALAADGEEAWDLLQREPFDVVVSDVSMPRLDGCGLVARVRAHPRLAQLPVILVTALGKPEEIAAGGRAGASEYLVKGRYESASLLAAVGRLA